jgi:putative addiction module component (TIGR02574 family)
MPTTLHRSRLRAAASFNPHSDRLPCGSLYRTLVDMIKETIPELRKHLAADKFALAVELWDELSSNPDEIPVTEEQLNELDRRLEEYRQDPDKVVTWEEAKARILSDLR